MMLFWRRMLLLLFQAMWEPPLLAQDRMYAGTGFTARACTAYLKIPSPPPQPQLIKIFR